MLKREGQHKEVKIKNTLLFVENPGGLRQSGGDEQGIRRDSSFRVIS